MFVCEGQNSIPLDKIRMNCDWAKYVKMEISSFRVRRQYQYMM